jgi:hypothetical protein
MRSANPLAVFFKALVLGMALATLTAWSMPFVTIFSPSFAKSTLESSGVYDTLAETSARILLQNETGGNSSGTDDAGGTAGGAAGAGSDSPALAGLAVPFEQTLTPELLQSVSESVIDSLDAWLTGETQIPRFAIDTAAIRSDLNDAVAAYTRDRLNTLPVCPSNTDYTEYDPFTATCRPPFEPSQDELLAWTDDFTSQIPLLGRDQVSDADLVQDPDDTAWRTIPDTYAWARVVLGVLAGLLVVITALVLILGKDRARTLRTLGHACVFPAVIFMIGGVLVASLAGTFVYDTLATDTQLQSDFADETVLPLLKAFVRGVGLWGIIFGAIFVALATAAYVTSHLLNKRLPAGGVTAPGWIGPDPRWTP